MVRIANIIIHRMLVDNGSAANIFFWDAYRKIGLTQTDLSLTTSPLYGFIGDHLISKETIKLAITLGEHPKVAVVATEFLVVDCQSAFNGLIGRSLLRTLKASTSICCLTMKFPTAAGIGQVRGEQWDCKECYNKSLELAEKREKLPQVLEVEKISKGPIETNIDPRLQEEESTVGLIEKLIEVQLDPNEASQVVKIDKGLESKQAQ